MKRFVEGVDREQGTLFPERLDDYIGEDNPVRVIDVFVDELDLGGLGASESRSRGMVEAQLSSAAAVIFLESQVACAVNDGNPMRVRKLTIA